MTIYKTTSWTLRSHPAHRFELTETLTIDGRHHMLRLLLDDNLYLAPVTSPRVRNPSSASVRRLLCAQRVLDVGTGTGIWLAPIQRP